MSQRTRRTPNPDQISYSDRDLENALNEFLQEQQAPEKVNLVNFTTITGFAILSITSLYLIQVLFPGLGPSIQAFDPNIQTVAIFGGALVALAAMGAFSRVKKKRLKKTLKSPRDNSELRSESHEGVFNDGLDSYGLKKRHKLFRSRSDKKIFGVCAGIASYLGINPFAVRLIWAIATLSSAGVTIPLYFFAALLLPKEPKTKHIKQSSEYYE